MHASARTARENVDSNKASSVRGSHKRCECITAITFRFQHDQKPLLGTGPNLSDNADYQPRSGAGMQPRPLGLGCELEQIGVKGRKTMSQTCGNIVLHFIFSTKERQPLITREIRADLFAYLGGIIREMRGIALIINGIPDHVHVLVRIRPVHSPAEIARVIKTNSSRWIHQKWHINFAWQAGYGVFSVSESNVPVVTEYIANQEMHHRKRSFQEELVAFLKKNNVSFDERYIWN